jgi:hypothetical protein
MKSINKNLCLSALFTATLVLSATATASNGTKKPPTVEKIEFNTSLLMTGKSD